MGDPVHGSSSPLGVRWPSSPHDSQVPGNNYLAAPDTVMQTSSCFVAVMVMVSEVWHKAQEEITRIIYGNCPTISDDRMDA